MPERPGDCPHCGCWAECSENNVAATVICMNEHCRAQISVTWPQTMGDAVAKWNQRMPPPHPTGICDVCKRLLPAGGGLKVNEGTYLCAKCYYTDGRLALQ